MKHKYFNKNMEAVDFFDTEAMELAVFTAKGTNRRLNQDCCGLDMSGSGQYLLVISDGMGGLIKPAQSSKAVVSTLIGRSTTSSTRKLKPIDIYKRIESANDKLKKLSSNSGATLVAVLLDKTAVNFFAVGDSTALLMSEAGNVTYRAFEHSVSGLARASGLISERDINESPDTNFVLNGLGFEDSRVESSLGLELKELGGLVLLSSDGLTDLKPADEFANELLHGNFREKVYEMVNHCSELRQNLEYYDDLSFIVGRIKPQK